MSAYRDVRGLQVDALERQGEALERMATALEEMAVAWSLHAILAARREEYNVAEQEALHAFVHRLTHRISSRYDAPQAPE